MKTIFEQTGWRRSHPKQICQELPILLKIKEFCFDLDNETFLQYFIDRTGYLVTHIGEGPGITREIIRPSLEWTKRKHFLRHSDEKWVAIYRGKIQDCWELFAHTSS